MKRILKPALLSLALLILLLTALALCPFYLVASPEARLRLVDEIGQPLAGMTAVRTWKTTEGPNGEDKTLTDANGVATFGKETVRMSLLKRITKPLLVFFPAMCGPGWEVYGETEFRLHWPEGYAPRSSTQAWINEVTARERRERVYIRDLSSPAMNKENCVQISLFNKKEPFDYTLTVYRNP